YSVALAVALAGQPGALATAQALQAGFHQALGVALRPTTLAVTLALSVLAAAVERRLDNAPEFPLGLLVGMGAVLATTALNALVLLWGGAEDWHAIVLMVFVAHLPVAVIEGVVLGFTVGFLARVKPEMLGATAPPEHAGDVVGEPPPRPATHAADRLPVALLLAALGLFGPPALAAAHNLEAEDEV